MRRLRVGSGRIRLKTVPQIMVHQRLGHLRPGAVRGADKQDSLLHFFGLFFSSSSARAKAGQKGSTRGCSSGRSLPCSTRSIPLLSGMISPTTEAGIFFPASFFSNRFTLFFLQVMIRVPSEIDEYGFIPNLAQIFSTSSRTMIFSFSILLPTR